MHIHTQIENAVRTLLTGLPTTGASVNVWRMEIFEKSELPAIDIALEGDEVVQRTMTPGGLESRQGSLKVAVVARKPSEVRAYYRPAMAEITAVMMANRDLGIGMKDMVLRSAEIGSEQGEGDAEVAVARLMFEVVWVQRPHDAETIL